MRILRRDVGKVVADRAARAWFALTLRWRLGDVGSGALVSRHALLRGDLRKITLGPNVTVGDFVHVWASGGVDIGADTLIAAHVVISSQGHDSGAVAKGLLYRKTSTKASVRIGRNVWIASAAVIGEGVTIGDGAIVGAGAVVLHDVPPLVVVAGVPARVVRELSERG